MFLHFFHDQILQTCEVQQRADRAPAAFNGTVRNTLRQVALLSADQLLIPTVDLVQSPLLEEVQPTIETLVAAELLRFIGSTSNSDELVHRKALHFADTGLHGSWQDTTTRARLKAFGGALHARSYDTTTDLLERWSGDIATLDSVGQERTFVAAQLHHARSRLPAPPSPASFERSLASVPERLDGHAFLWPVIESLGILDFETTRAAQRHFELATAHEWIESHLEEYDTRIVGNLPYFGDISCGINRTHPDRVVDLAVMSNALAALSIDRAVNSLTIDEVVRLRAEPAFCFLRSTAIPALYSLIAAGDASSRTLAQVPVLSELAKTVSDVQDHHDAYTAVMTVSDRFLAATSSSSITPVPVVQQAIAQVQAALVDCADYQGLVRERFDALIEQLLRFLMACMNAQPQDALRRRKYLFDAEATEAALAADVQDWLRGNMTAGAMLAEVQQIGGGRPDLLATFDGFRFPIEFKLERQNSSPESLRRFLPQVALYEATDVSLGVLMILDQSAREASIPSLRDNVWVERADSQINNGGSRMVVVVRIPGNRRTPSRSNRRRAP